MIEFKSNKSSWKPLIALLIIKAFRGGGLIIGNFFLNKLSYSLINFVFFIMLISTPIAFLISKPKLSDFLKRKWMALFHSFLFIINLILWCVGLKYFGAIKTILAFDYGSILLSQVFHQLGDANKQDFNQTKGIFCMSSAYILLLFIDTPTQTTTQTIQEVLQSPGQVTTEGLSLVFGVTERKIGALAVIVCLLVEIIRKSIAKKFSSQVGGHKPMIAGSSLIGLVIITVVAVFYPVFANSFGLNSGTFENNGVKMSFLEQFGALIFVCLFVVIGDHIAEPAIRLTVKKSLLVTLPSISISYLSVFLIEWWNGTNSSSVITFVSFFLVLAGIYFINQNQEKHLDTLPIYSTANYSSSKNVLVSFFKSSISIIWKDITSRKIFIFLCCNLSFMFIEMIYGFLSNSLGLISDAFHMLFDCTALGIGLYASIISKWEPSGNFSFGYARVEILSGFVNGVFLLFIGFFVLVESLQRFVEPPEVKAERLIFVSVIGFIVNMIGLYAFHDHSGHGHSHGGGHGHSHGGGHSHKKDKKKEDHHGHSHSHKKKDKHKEHDIEEDHHHHHDDHDIESEGDHSHSHSHSHSHKKDKKKNKHEHDSKEDHHHHHDHDKHDHNDSSSEDHHGHSHSHKKDKHKKEGHGHSHSHKKDDHQHHKEKEKEINSNNYNNNNNNNSSSSENYINFLKKTNDLPFELSESYEKDNGEEHFHDENMQGIFLHVLADTLGSVGVIFSSILIYFFEIQIADAICSFVISVMILVSTIPLLKSTASTLLQGSPKQLAPKLRNGLRNILKVKNIVSIKNPHFWTLAGENVIGTIEILIDGEGNDQIILHKVSSILTDAGVTNVTIQIDKI